MKRHKALTRRFSKNPFGSQCHPQQQNVHCMEEGWAQAQSEVDAHLASFPACPYGVRKQPPLPPEVRTLGRRFTCELCTPWHRPHPRGPRPRMEKHPLKGSQGRGYVSGQDLTLSVQLQVHATSSWTGTFHSRLFGARVTVGLNLRAVGPGQGRWWASPWGLFPSGALSPEGMPARLCPHPTAPPCRHGSSSHTCSRPPPL